MGNILFMRNLFFFILFIFCLFSCNNKQERKQESTHNDDFVASTNEEQNEFITIDKKLNLTIPGIGSYAYKYLFSFDRVEFARDGHGHEELLERIRNSYLNLLTPGPFAMIFDDNGLIDIYFQLFRGEVPNYGDGINAHTFVVIGKFVHDYDDEYNASINFTDEYFDDEIVVTFDNYLRGSHNYKLYVYYKLIE